LAFAGLLGLAAVLAQESIGDGARWRRARSCSDGDRERPAAVLAYAPTDR
jgi:hypothetical protein